MKSIYLHGSLGARFGGPFSLAVRDPLEAVRALSVQLRGFREAVTQGDWRIIRGTLEEGEALDLEGCEVALGQVDEIHLVPAAAGAGPFGSSVGSIVTGGLLIGAAFMTGGTGLAGIASWGMGATAMGAVGAGLVLGGVSQMLMQPPEAQAFGSREPAAQRPSFLFDGPVNTSSQGVPVPLIYGRVRTGSVVISASLTAEDIS